MIRPFVLSSATTDLDADAHVDALIHRHGGRHIGTVCRDWPLVARAAARLMRMRDKQSTLIAVGSAAWRAARLGWRGPILCVPTIRALSTGPGLLGRRSNVRVVVSSLVARQRLANAGWDGTRLDLIHPTVATPPDRQAARRALHLPDDAITIAMPGTVTARSGHRLAIWTAAILGYRDPAWRFLVSARGDSAFAREFITASLPTGAMCVIDQADDATLIAAADVALLGGQDEFERSVLDIACRANVPIVACRTLLATENRLPADPHQAFDCFRPRDVARAILNVIDRRADPSPQSSESPQASGDVVGTTWDVVLNQTATAHADLTTSP